MIPSVEEGKNAFLKVYTAEIKRDHPSWTFARCWQAAQAEHPDLAESFEAPAAASQSYRYDPSKPPAADQAKLDELLSRFMPKKIEARKPREREKEKTMLVYAKSGELLGEVIFD